MGEPLIPAKLKTISLPLQTSIQLLNSRKSTLANVTPFCARLESSKETTVTLASSFISFSTNGLPIKPVPPVTNTFLFLTTLICLKKNNSPADQKKLFEILHAQI